MQKKIWIIIIISFFLNEINIFKLLIGNKCDLESDRKVIFQEGKEYVKRIDMKFIEILQKLIKKLMKLLKLWLMKLLDLMKKLIIIKKNLKKKKRLKGKIEKYKS